MKKTSETQMLDAMRFIMPYCEENRDCQRAFDLLTNILRSEMNDCKVGKFNLRNFCSKDIRYPAMHGILHEDGFKVATNRFVLCAVKESYPEYLEGRILDDKGEFINFNFPRWKSVIPKDDLREIKINIDKFLESEKELKALQKDKSYTVTTEDKIRIGNWVGLIKEMKLFINFIAQYKVDTIYYKQENYPILAKALDGAMCLAVPVYVDGLDLSKVASIEA